MTEDGLTCPIEEEDAFACGAELIIDEALGNLVSVVFCRFILISPWSEMGDPVFRLLPTESLLRPDMPPEDDYKNRFY